MLGFIIQKFQLSISILSKEHSLFFFFFARQHKKVIYNCILIAMLMLLLNNRLKYMIHSYEKFYASLIYQ
jgi:hypothetical protein